LTRFALIGNVNPALEPTSAAMLRSGVTVRPDAIPIRGGKPV